MFRKKLTLNKNKIKTGPVKARIALYFVFSLLFFTSVVCKRENDSPEIDTANKKNTQTIQFKKQGEVYFQDTNKNLLKGIDVEIAETDDSRHRGLMFREKMEDNQGMLFIFGREEPESFYMKNTLIPLDIIFVTSKREIIKIYKNTTPLSEKDLPSLKPIKYVVEVNAGFTDKYNIKEGDYIEWRRN